MCGTSRFDRVACVSALAVLLGSVSLAPGQTDAVDENWWSAVQEDIRAAEYHLTWQDETGVEDVPGAWHAPNRAHGFRTYFTPNGFRVVPRSDDVDTWEWGLSFLGVGRDGVLNDAGEAILSPFENRIDYARGDLTEWFVNGPEGLKHGFTISSPPPGDRRAAPLRIDLALTGTLRPDFSEDGQAIDFVDSSGARVLHYAGLIVTDARDRELTAWMEGFAGHGVRGIRIVVDDVDAVYPVTVDPLASSPSWSASGRYEGDHFGYSVASAGDVNGDGYGDVVVGAPDGGHVYVYHGSPHGLEISYAWISAINMSAGYSVAPAGDVDGDGYGDVVVGVPDLHIEEALGEILLYTGSEDGISGGSVWLLEPCTASWAACGTSVASAGDVNGDGYSDIIVSGPRDGDNYEGRTFVYHGSPSGFGPSYDWMAESDTIGTNVNTRNFGASVATAGDVNGDGYSDVIVGYPHLATAYVWHGGPGGLGADGTPANADWTGTGASGSSLYGRSVAPAGDINGDGYGDVVVGAPEFSGTSFNAGRAYVYHGTAAGLGASPALVVDGERYGSKLGRSVMTAGDVNGDGFGDVIFGASEHSDDQTEEGRAYVHYGRASGLDGGPAWQVEGNQTRGWFGFAVATAGDVNGDGFADVMVGAPYRNVDVVNDGAAYVFHGGPEGLDVLVSWTSHGDQADGQLGFSVASAGDVDGDGYGDVIVGARLYDAGQTDEGKAFVYLGSENGPSMTADWTAECNQAGARLGWRVASAGDVNGDGASDVIVGAPYYDLHASPNHGAAFLWEGSGLGLGPDGDLTNVDWRADGRQENAYFGYSVATAGDVNGDGYSDVIIGSPYYDDGQTDEGGIFVWHGSDTGLGDNGVPTGADWRAFSDQAGARLGATAASAGDVNGDGFSDVISGAYRYDVLFTDEGTAYAWYGSRTGLGPDGSPSNFDWSQGGMQAGAYYGFAVASAGDVNGDGFSDVLVGAHGYDDIYTNEGRFYSYLGSASGLSTSTSTVLNGGQDEAGFGYALASAGDVNADGFADVVIGAYLYDDSDTDTGKVWVFFGSASGISLTDVWSMGGPNADALYGRSVASAGDVNGDGFADVLVGVPGANQGLGGEGGAFIYYGNGPAGGRTVLPQQRRNGGGPLLFSIDRLGRSDHESAFKIAARGHGLLGRGDVKLEWEVKPVGVPFDGNGLQQAATWTDSTASYAPLVEPVGALASGAYHWRVRVRQRAATSPFQPWGRWLTQPWGGWNETDLRVWRDGDGDDVPDEQDNCPADPNPGQEDPDQDGFGSACDNCPDDDNPGQEDADADGAGDECDTCTDTDGDGYGDPGYKATVCTLDNCPGISNPGQEDSDADGIGDVCDDCTDIDGDGYGDPGYPASTCDLDNCPAISNPGQEDMDSDGIGDVCDPDRDGDAWDNAADCSPDDGTLWSAPTAVLDLRISKDAADNLTWSAPADPGSSTPIRYDVLVSTVPNDWGIFEAECAESDDTDTVATETSNPLPGEVYHYLVRAENVCGSNMGADSAGAPRTGRDCTP